MNYLLGCGYFQKSGFQQTVSGRHPQRFHYLWHQNNLRFCDPPPQTTVCISVGGFESPALEKVQRLTLSGNPGHTHTKTFLTGGPAIILALAMLAYTGGHDLIYKEQDCLAFGPWVKRMYYDCRNKWVCFGSCKCMGATMALLLVKREYIPLFIRDYIEAGPEDVWERFPEIKLATLERRKPSVYARLSFGYDRDRPIHYSDRVFYAQHLEDEDLQELRAMDLI